MIPLNQCRHGFLYRLRSRNLILGIYNKETQGFIGLREKFGHVYLFTEYHWDIGAPHGTARPQEELEQCNLEFNVNNQELFQWLTNKKKEYERSNC